jgi:hypothetical protein
MVESQPSKLLVAGSIPVSRSSFHRGTLSPGPPFAVARGGPGAPLRSGVARLGAPNEVVGLDARDALQLD